ncbi:hypothetical protein ACJX0J_040240, partial [Zea mays]
YNWKAEYMGSSVGYKGCHIVHVPEPILCRGADETARHGEKVVIWNVLKMWWGFLFMIRKINLFNILCMQIGQVQKLNRTIKIYTTIHIAHLKLVLTD